ncbi:hypothetical protein METBISCDRAFT_19502, partial [Metschnikowia bicuspidata]
LAAVEALIRNELESTNTAAVHPRAMEVLPLSTNLPCPLLLADVARLEELMETDSSGDALHVLSPAIDMERYVEFGSGDDIEYDRMYTALSYGILRVRNSRLMQQNMRQGLDAQRALKMAVDDFGRMYSGQIQRKRLQVDEINGERLRKQTQFEPVGGYLEMRWQSGIQLLADKGIALMEDA